MEELWRPVPGYEGRYEVSSLGRARRLAYCVEYYDNRLHRIVSRKYESKIVSTTPDKVGYRKLRVSGKTMLIHILVLEAFAGPRPHDMIACHGPNGISDNSINNLSWGTRRKNMYDDKIRDGTLRCGTDHYLAKLDEEKVRYIRNNITKLGYKTLSKLFDVSPGCINGVVRRVTWKHVD